MVALRGLPNLTDHADDDAPSTGSMSRIGLGEGCVVRAAGGGWTGSALGTGAW